MDRIKNFIKKKKLDKKFKQAGQGYVLQDEDGMISQPGFPCRIPAPQSPTQSDPALQKPIAVPTRPDVSAIAQAAEKRMAKAKPANQDLTPMQKLVKMQAQRELEREQRKLAEQMGHIRTQDDQGPSQQQQRQMHQPKVLYTCELFDEEVALPKSEMLSAVEECLFEQLKDGEADPISTVVYIIYTLNKEDVRNPAVETMLKYLQNIINNPEEVKFRRIRLSNKVFKEKVAPCKGAIEFLKVVGFHEEKQSVDGNGNNGEMEMFLVLPQPNMGSLVQMQNALANGKTIAIRVYRDRKVFYIDPFAQLTNPEIPEDFFMRTADEIKREQQQRTEALEKMSVLRTQKMREMDAAREKLNSTFKYTYIRIRFPDNFMLQGIFNVFEKLTAVREFVHKSLEIGHGSFSLTAPQLNKQQQSDMDEKTLVQLGLVPTSLLYFEWDGETKRQFEHEGTQIAYLKRELIEVCQKHELNNQNA